MTECVKCDEPEVDKRNNTGISVKVYENSKAASNLMRPRWKGVGYLSIVRNVSLRRFVVLK